MQKPHVELTRHAIDRWREYKGKESVPEITRIISRHIAAKLKTGIIVDKTSAGQVQIEKDLWATVQVTYNGWKVVTFHHGEHIRGREEDGDNAAG